MGTSSNVLLITSDEHRRDAMGAYGNVVAPTSILDVLANQGVRFNICGHDKAGLLEGSSYVCQWSLTPVSSSS